MSTNGQLPASSLGYVSGHRVRADLVPQTQAMLTAAAAAGTPLSITQGYRSYAEQVSLFTSRYTRTRLPNRPYRVWNNERWWQKPGTAVAAVPGTSEHGWAQAIDFVVNADAPGALSWLTANGPAYGWKRPGWTHQAGTIEPWHHEATHIVPVAPIGDDEMTPAESNMLFHIGALLAETPHRTALEVAGTPVSRVAGQPSTWLQDDVDGTTAALSTAAALATIADTLARIEAKLA